MEMIKSLLGNLRHYVVKKYRLFDNFEAIVLLVKFKFMIAYLSTFKLF